MLGTLLALAASVTVPSNISPPIVTVKRPVIVIPASTPTAAISRGMVRLYPEEAVMKAAAAAPGFVDAVFDLTVRRTDQVGSEFFLNSEEDYRDSRNISVVLSPEVQRQLRSSLGDDLSKYFFGHHLLVLGAATRVRIDFIDDNGKATDKYYYQTHVRVMNVRQLERTELR